MDGGMRSACCICARYYDCKRRMQEEFATDRMEALGITFADCMFSPGAGKKFCNGYKHNWNVYAPENKEEENENKMR